MDKEAIRDLAITVFSDSLASELEQLSQDSSIPNILDSDELRDLHSCYFIQQDLTKSMPQLLEDLEIKIEPHLPIDNSVKEILKTGVLNLEQAES